jgi:integrase/recombinase XerD
MPILRTNRGDLLGFIAWRVETGARPRSTARQLSSFRRFFRYLRARGHVMRDDPTAQIAMPKIGRSLPKSLTEEEVESLLNRRRWSPIRSASRDRTMLEVLYATGLRVSELVSLKYNAAEPQPGRDPRARQGRSRAVDPAGRGSRPLAQGIHRTGARRDPARSHRPTISSRPAAATA